MKRGFVKSKFVKNTSWIMVAQIIYLIISFFMSIISARILGPDDYGVYNYCYSILLLITPLATLCLDSILVKELVNRKESNGKILGSGIVFRIISSIIMLLIALIMISILKKGQLIYIIITIIISSSFLFKSFDLIELWFQSRLESKYASIAKTTVAIVSTIIKLLILFITRNVIWFSFGLVIDMLFLMFGYLYVYKRNGGPKFSFDINEGENLVRISSSFIISTFFISLYSKLDQIMIGNFLPIAYVGFYSVAIFFESSWYFIPTAIINSAKPFIFDNSDQNVEMRNKRIKQLYAAIFWMGIVVAFIFSLISDKVILAVYGTQYVASITATNIIMWAGAFSMTGTVRAIWLLCANKQKYTINFVVLGVVLNGLLNYLLIPLLGISGAAIATLITQIFQVMICPIFFKETRECAKIMLDGILFKW